MTAVDAASRWPGWRCVQLWFKDEPVMRLVLVSNESTWVLAKGAWILGGVSARPGTERQAALRCALRPPCPGQPVTRYSHLVRSHLSPYCPQCKRLLSSSRPLPRLPQGVNKHPSVRCPGSWLLAASPGPNLPRGPSTSPLLSRGKASCSSKAHRRGLVAVWEGSVLWLHPDCRLCLWEPTPWHHAPAPSTARPEGAGGLLVPLGCQLLGTGTGTHLAQ